MPTPTNLRQAEALIRARVLAILESVEGVGRTYDYFRNVKSEAVRKALLKDAGTASLHFWFLTLANEPPLTQRRDGTVSKVTLVYELHGHMAVNDAQQSEKVFAGKVLDVLTAFNGAQKLVLDEAPVAGVLVQDSGPIQWPQAGHVEFTEVLAHYARVVLPVVFGGGDC